METENFENVANAAVEAAKEVVVNLPVEAVKATEIMPKHTVWKTGMTPKELAYGGAFGLGCYGLGKGVEWLIKKRPVKSAWNKFQRFLKFEKEQKIPEPEPKPEEPKPAPADPASNNN